MDPYRNLPDDIKNPPMFYDFEGNPIGLRTWTRLFEEADRQLALTEVSLPDGRPARVSTIWMGINRAFIDGAPNIFETGVLTATDLLYECRCSTRAEALADHEQMVAFVKLMHEVPQSHAYDAERARDDFRWEAEQ